MRAKGEAALLALPLVPPLALYSLAALFSLAPQAEKWNLMEKEKRSVRARMKKAEKAALLSLADKRSPSDCLRSHMPSIGLQW